MQKFLFFLVALCVALFMSACSSFEVTRELADAYSEMAIQYHDQKYMEEQELKVPDGVNEKRFEKLPFLIGFKAADPVKPGERADTNQFSEKEWAALKREFETVLDGSRRFPLAQVVEGLADAELRLKTRNGTANVTELDASSLKETKYIINVTAQLGTSESTVKRERTLTSNMTAVCRPMEAENNAPISWFPPFTISTDSKIYQKVNGFGNVVAGFNLYTQEQREKLHMNMFRGALVEFINHIYLCFPTGGKVVNINEDGLAKLKASRANGVQDNMQFIIYAMEKGNPDAIRVPLYNAVAETVGQEDSTTLKIWRASEKKSAKKIIAKIENDFREAVEEYDIYACSDGLAQRPGFIETNKKADR